MSKVDLLSKLSDEYDHLEHQIEVLDDVSPKTFDRLNQIEHQIQLLINS